MVKGNDNVNDNGDFNVNCRELSVNLWLICGHLR